MPRWPEKDSEIKLVPPPEERAEQDESTAENIGLPSNDTNILVRSLSGRVDDLNIAFMRMIDALNGHLPMIEVLPSTGSAIKLQRRRTEDEMRRALSLLTTPGAVRQRDDECEEILTDAIGEVIALRQITMDVMQTITTAHQNGLASIRKLTER